MINIPITQLQSDIAGKMKGTSIREIKDFYGTAQSAANRMLARIDPQETIRTSTMTTPFFDNINDYALVSDMKRMIDIRPQVNRMTVPGRSHYTETAPRQFLERLDADSFSIRYNNMVRSLRSQRLPAGNVIAMDSFDSSTANGSWSAEGDASGLYTEVLNFVEGNGALGMNLSGGSGSADIVNSTAAVTDLSSYLYEDSSSFYVWIPIGFAARFTSFTLRRGSSASAYKQVSISSKADGTAFTDGWNLLRIDWSLATTVGSPDNTKNTYRRFGITYTAGAAISGVLLDNWTNSLGTLAEIEYYSEHLFRDVTGVWKNAPTVPTDLLNVGPASYEIFKTEFMIDVTQQIRTGKVMDQQLADFRLQLNGQPQTRYVKDPPYHGLYADYLKQFPSSAIVTATRTYDFDV
jgi:hypothetical protein